MVKSFLCLAVLSSYITLGKEGSLMNLVNFRDLLRLVSCLLPENLFVYTYLGGHVSNVCGCL